MTRDFIPVGIAVLTVSDTRTAADDRSGDRQTHQDRRHDSSGCRLRRHPRPPAAMGPDSSGAGTNTGDGVGSGEYVSPGGGGAGGPGGGPPGGGAGRGSRYG